MRPPLTGTWELVQWVNRTADGAEIFPLGANATGYICYSEDGYVFVHMAAADRALFATPDPFDASPQEDSAAMKSHITYAGTFEEDGAQVLHHVTQASCPNWVGSVQRRAMRFLDANTLELSASGVSFQGRDVTACVTWTRARNHRVTDQGGQP